MQGLMLAVLLPTLVLAQGQPMNEAEKLFRGMEEKLAKASTVQVAFEGQLEGIDNSKWKGILVLGGENKVRLAFDGATIGGRGKHLIVADGTDLKLTGPKGMPEAAKCPGKTTEYL